MIVQSSASKLLTAGHLHSGRLEAGFNTLDIDNLDFVSSSGNINENCDLSELSTQNIDAEKELKEDSDWGVYGVAEDDSCEDDQEETSTKKEEPKSKNKRDKINS